MRLQRRGWRAHDDRLNPLFLAAVEATEEAIVDSLFTARTVRGRDGHVAPELPVDATLEILRKHGKVGS